jgi:predicted dehydrogenase
MQKLRLIQCGMGGMGKAWWQNATSNSPDFDLVAIADISDVPLNEAGEALAIPQERRFSSLKQALKKVEADAVLTVTPPAIHSEHARLVFSRGLHVITEKPIAGNLADAKKMVRWAEDAGKQLVVTQNYRFHPPMKTLRKLLAEKPLGAFGHGALDFYIGADFTGSFRETMDFPLLLDMSIHHMDLIRAVTGKNIAKVSVQSFRPEWSWYKHQPGLNMLMELEDGTPFSYRGDWSALGKQTSWNGDWRLQCAQGSINYADNEIKLWKCEKWGKNVTSEKVEIIDDQENPQARLLADFAKAIRTGQRAETSGKDNLWSFGAVIAGVMSAQKGGKAIEVAKLLGLP